MARHSFQESQSEVLNVIVADPQRKIVGGLLDANAAAEDMRDEIHALTSRLQAHHNITRIYNLNDRGRLSQPRRLRISRNTISHGSNVVADVSSLHSYSNQGVDVKKWADAFKKVYGLHWSTCEARNIAKTDRRMVNTLNMMANVRVLSYWEYPRKQTRVDRIRSLSRRVINTWLCHQNVLFAARPNSLSMYQGVVSLFGDIVVAV